MKKANYHFTALFIVSQLFFACIAYSQWTICGNLTGIEGRPTVSVVDENTAWVTGGSTINSTYRTSNGGNNWTNINTVGINPFFCLWAKDANTLFAGDNGGSGVGMLYKTTNGGISWTLIDTAGTGFGGIKFSLSMPLFGVAFSGSETDIIFLKTRDGGNTWSRTSIPTYPGYGLSISGCNVIDSLFYAMGTTTGIPSIIMTTNGGVTYDLRNTSLPSVGGNFTRGIAFSNDKLTGIAGSTSLPTISRTTDGGLNWTNVSVGNFVPISSSPVMRWIEGTNTCYLTNNYSIGILKSINGGMNWTEMTTAGLGIFNMDTKRIGSTVYGYAVSFLSGSTSAIVKTADPIATKRFFANCTTPTPKLFTKGNLSANGVHTTFGPGEPVSYTGMEFDNKGVLYCIPRGANPVLQTLDTTSGVLTTLGPITGLNSPDLTYFTLAYNTVDNKMYLSAFVTFADPSSLYTLNLMTREATLIGEGMYGANDIAINSSGNCYGIASADNIFFSIDIATGAHTSIGSYDYTSGNFLQGLCFDRETDVLYIAAWNNDSLRSELRTINLTNATTTLISLFNPDLGRMSGFAMPFNTSVGIQNISSQVPDGYTLKQNYPNPFNPVTKLEFGISELGFVSLKVYDVLGKEVATLVNADLSPGTYKYDFDARNLSSGVYFYKLEANGFVDTKKMYLVK